MRRPVQVVGPVRGVDRVPQRDLVRDHQDGCLRPLEQALERVGITPRRVVERLATGKRIAARVCVLPRAVVVEGLPFQLPDADVAELGILLERHVAAGERHLRGLARAQEVAVQAELQRDVRDLFPQQARLVTALFRQAHPDAGIAVDAILVVQRRLAVARDHVELHGAQVSSRLL